RSRSGSTGSLARKLAAGDTKLVLKFQLTPELRAGNFAGEQLPVFRNDQADVLGSFIKEFEPEMARAERQHSPNIVRARLGASVEESIAAAGIGLERMLGANPVAQAHPMFVTGPAAVGVVGPIGEKSAKDTMFHV